MSNLKQTAKITLRISIAVLCLLYLGQEAFCQQVIKHENQETSLQGTIRLVHGYGPPGYGEDPKHDSHVSYWALEVPVPINTPCTESDFGCDPAKRLKLFFPNTALARLNDEPAAKWKGQAVVIVGKLHHAETAGEMTPIYIDVTSIVGSTATAQPLQNGITPTGAPALCNYAKVYRLTNGEPLRVHATAAMTSVGIDSLHNGEDVYTCDETASWFQIFYGSTDKPCRAGTPNGLPITHRNDCRSGWVPKKQINVISG